MHDSNLFAGLEDPWIESPNVYRHLLKNQKHSSDLVEENIHPR